MRNQSRIWCSRSWARTTIIWKRKLGWMAYDQALHSFIITITSRVRDPKPGTVPLTIRKHGSILALLSRYMTNTSAYRESAYNQLACASLAHNQSRFSKYQTLYRLEWWDSSTTQDEVSESLFEANSFSMTSLHFIKGEESRLKLKTWMAHRALFRL